MRSGGGDGDPVGRKRRYWTADEKRRIVDESLEDGASLAEIARRHDLNANQLFTWRRQFGVEPAEPKDLGLILPVTIAPETAAEESDPGPRGQMEIPSPCNPWSLYSPLSSIVRFCPRCDLLVSGGNPADEIVGRGGHLETRFATGAAHGNWSARVVRL